MLLTYFIILLFLLLAIIQTLTLFGKLNFPQGLLRLGIALALMGEAWCLYSWIEVQGGQNLNVWLMLSLTLWMMALLIFLTFNEALNKLTPPIYTLCALSMLIPLNRPTMNVVATDQHLGVLFHILISFMATSVLFLAGAQAMIVSLQSHFLKQSLQNPVLQMLPPLMHMERLLFVILTAGFILLTFSLISGYVYLDHFLSPSLFPKTLLATLAWLMFGLILGARLHQGLRGQSAVRLTGLATGLLFLSYFGTKFIYN